jgi:hypothetical protein
MRALAPQTPVSTPATASNTGQSITAPVPIRLDPSRIEIADLPSPARSPYPESMPGLMSVSDDSEEDTVEMRDEAMPAQPRSDAQRVFDYIYEFYITERARLRQKLESDLRSTNAGRTDPSVLNATLWGGYLMVCDALRASLTGDDETDFSQTSRTIMPFFDLLSERISTHGMDQKIQVVRAGDCIDRNSDILVFKTSTFRHRLLNLKAKHRSISIDRAEGFRPKGLYDREDVRMAHAAQNIISLSMGGSAYVQAPFPPHLLRDSFAIRRYEQLCVPGTVFYENMPTLIHKMRVLYALCVICGGLHLWDEFECRRRHEAERLLVSQGYLEIESESHDLYYPEYLKENVQYNAQFYSQVFPGSVFLFDRVPMAILAARKHFRVCDACGILHLTTLASPLLLHCPYNIPELAQRFVEHTHRYENAHCTPAMSAN